jgi:hypothetical protein
MLFSHPGVVAGMAWMYTEELDRAGAVLGSLYRASLDHGEESAIPLRGYLAACLACRMGDLDGAARYARTTLETAANVGGNIAQALGLTAQATVDAYRGEAGPARRQATEAADLFRRSGWVIPALIWPTWVLGFIELSAGDPAATHRILGPVSQVVLASTLAEPGVLSVPDDIEALVEMGELDQAETLLDWLEGRAGRLERAWALGSAGRCRALLLAARGDLNGAAAALAGAIAQLDRVPLPLDRGRAFPR